MMDLPAAREGGENYLKVDPNFTAIFTSNPEEYAGVHRSQDALRDRMITLDVDHFDRETEIGICESKSGISRPEAEGIVSVVRGLRESDAYEFAPTVRGSIMIAKTLKVRGGAVSARDRIFRETCLDILSSETSRVGSKVNVSKVKKVIEKLIEKHCSGDGGHIVEVKVDKKKEPVAV